MNSWPKRNILLILKNRDNSIMRMRMQRSVVNTSLMPKYTKHIYLHVSEFHRGRRINVSCSSLKALTFYAPNIKTKPRFGLCFSGCRISNQSISYHRVEYMCIIGNNCIITVWSVSCATCEEEKDRSWYFKGRIWKQQAIYI